MKTLDQTLSETDVLRAKLDTLRPLSSIALEKMQNALNIAYTHESNRIEGNTLTLQETALVINEGLTISGKSMREHRHKTPTIFLTPIFYPKRNKKDYKSFLYKFC